MNQNVVNLHNSINKYFSYLLETKYLENIVLYKNYNIIFDHTINFNGYFVNGLIYNKNNKITIKINPYSTESILFILIHELTHVLNKNKLKELVINYLIQELDLIKDNYIISDELICDIAGVLLGNTKFLNYLYYNNTYNIDINNNYDRFINTFRIIWEYCYKNKDIILNRIEYSINTNFIKEYNQWNKLDRNGYFFLGTTSKALKSIGLDERNVVIDKSKILTIKNKHLEMTDDIIKQIPNILENPTIILKSQSVSGRLVVFGDITATDGKPVLVAMELNPAENNANVDKIYKVASAYGRQNVKYMQNWLNNPNNILYIDSQKNRTINWLNGLGLQLPVP